VLLQQVEHRLPPPLRQLGDRVGGVVRAHPGQHPGDLLIGARAEQAGGPVLVKFLEDIRLELRVGVHVAEDLGFLFLGGVLKQVCDLGWLQPADPGERPAQQRAALVPDERLEVMPVAEAMPVVLVLRRGQPEQPARAAPGIHSGQDPLAVNPGELQVGGPDQAGILHVDEPVPEHVGAQQHLSFPTLEVPQVQPRA
jgi:hypothetical protein